MDPPIPHVGVNLVTNHLGLFTASHAVTHNIAQFVYCLAQGKVGSGFDGASSTLGSVQRFQPHCSRSWMT